MFQRLGIKKIRSCRRSPAEPKAENKASFPRLLNLPVPLMTLISTYWNQQDVHQLNRAFTGLFFYYSYSQAVANRSSDENSLVLYRPMGAFLHRLYNVLPAEAKLLNHVVNADYEQIIKANPSLMFTYVNFRYRDGSSECISPLKYAFKVYDTYTWFLFYKKIKNNPQYVEKFIEQANEQITHIDLDPLFEAYKEYEKERQRFEQFKNAVLGFSLKEFKRAREKLQAMQRKFLPAHMLVEFARGGDTWNFNSTFDVNAKLPASNQFRIYDSNNFLELSVASIIAKSNWDDDFMLMRGVESPNAKTLRAITAPNTCLLEDSMIFHTLFEIRKNDFSKLMTSLARRSHKKSTLCRLSNSE